MSKKMTQKQIWKECEQDKNRLIVSQWLCETFADYLKQLKGE